MSNAKVEFNLIVEGDVLITSRSGYLIHVTHDKWNDNAIVITQDGEPATHLQRLGAPDGSEDSDIREVIEYWHSGEPALSEEDWSSGLDAADHYSQFLV